MPSPIGHLLAGVAIGWAAEPLPAQPVPRPAAFRPWTRFALLCALLAAVPDLDLLYPPIHRRVTHGLGAVLLTTILAGVVTGWVTRRQPWKIALACGLAYGSHVLLDLLGRDVSAPYGLRALWPFSDRWFISGWDVFPGTERRDIFSSATMLKNLRAVVQETAVLGPVAALVYWMRRRRSRSADARMPESL